MPRYFIIDILCEDGEVRSMKLKPDQFQKWLIELTKLADANGIKYLNMVDDTPLDTCGILES